ncbi:MAG: hypothetical protein Q8R43_02735 [Alphaproteobacteria bacterium]|nr:hypothetical protein [Alphaproteobacteria bacterium]
MKKIIRVMLLSTVAFCHVAFGSNPTELNEDAVEGMVISGDPVEPVMGVENPILTEAVSMLQTIREGFVPTAILELFSGIPKIDVSQRTNPAAIQAMSLALKSSLRNGLDDDGLRSLNILLKVITTPMAHMRSVTPLAWYFFGEINEDVAADPFFSQVAGVYNILFADSTMDALCQINNSLDWVTVQFLGLFFDNAILNLRFNVNVAGLGNVDLIRDVVSELNGAASLNLLGVNGFQDCQQVELLKAIAEDRPEHTHIIAAVEIVEDLESFVKSITDPNLHTYSEGAKIDICLIVNFQHRELHERRASFTAMFERISNRAVRPMCGI